ncbi:MAG TPA: oligosaccharide flippase family protein [Pyrinomonadaceae bacterium]|nr:oligosaccharide flippase family protein [Pyrinomonadaceae bacterium]
MTKATQEIIQEEPREQISLTGQSAWLLFAKITGFALSFLLPLLTVRYLTQDKIGVYRQTFLVITNCVSILPLGFSMSAYYFLNRQPEKRASTIFHILLFNFVTGGAACLLLVLYPQLLGNVFQNQELTRLAPLVGVVVWLWIFSTFLEIVALANRETHRATFYIIFAQFTKTVLMAGALIGFSTVEAFVYAAIAQGALQTVVLLVYLNSRFPKFWRAFELKFFREQIIYALPFGLAGLLYIVQTDVHNYFVGYRFSAAEYAIYAYGCFELPLMGMLYESISAVMIPRMTELQAQNKKREMLLTTVAAMQKLALAYFPFFVFLSIVAEEFITTLFTKEYLGSVPIFRINLLLLPFYCLMLDPIGRAFPEVGRFLLKVRVVLFFALLAALYFGINNFDLRGMIGIVVVTVLIERLVSLSKILRILEVKRADAYLLKNVGKTAIAALASGVILFVFYSFAKDFLLEICLNFSRNILALIYFEKASEFFGGSLFLAIWFAVFGAAYLFFVVSSGALEADDKEKLKNVLRKIIKRGGSSAENKPALPLTNRIQNLKSKI